MQMPHGSVLKDRMRGSLWVMPAVAVLASIALALVLDHVDVQGPLGRVLFTGDASGARAVLTTVVGSVITVTSLTFSITVVTLQLASGQFSPRLLRTFLRDPGTQAVLSVLLATAAYGLTVLRSVGSLAVGVAGVPQLSVTIAYLYVLASLAALVYFLQHIAGEIRVDNMMRKVRAETRAAVERVFPDELQEDADSRVHEELSSEPPDHAVMVEARRSGFLQFVDVDQLLDVAREREQVLLLEPAVGDFVVQGTPVAWAWPVELGATTPDAMTLAKAVDRALTLSNERTIEQDVPFGLRQLADIAAKALSPGVNDPTTAVHALTHIDDLLSLLARRRVGHDGRRDDAGRVRVVVPRCHFPELVELGCGQVRRYGGAEPAVLVALLRALQHVAGSCRTGPQRAAVHHQLELTLAAARRGVADKADLRLVEQQAEPVLAALRAPWRPGATRASLRARSSSTPPSIARPGEQPQPDRAHVAGTAARPDQH